MPRLKKIIALIVLVCKLTLGFSQSSTYPIKIYTNGYRGYVAISSNTGADFFLLQKDTTVFMKQARDGSYFINIGSSIGECKSTQTSYIYMTFDKNGAIDSTSLCPNASVTLGKDHKSIHLQTTLININPGFFNRNWYPSFLKPTVGFLYGKHRVRLIKGQTYNINQEDAVLRCLTCEADENYTAAFYFTVNKFGRVVLYGRNRIAATACGHTLIFKTRWLTIDPNEIADGKPLYFGNTASTVPLISRRTKRPFIPGTVSALHWKDSTGKVRAFHFLPL